MGILKVGHVLQDTLYAIFLLNDCCMYIISIQNKGVFTVETEKSLFRADRRYISYTISVQNQV